MNNTKAIEPRDSLPPSSPPKEGNRVLLACEAVPPPGRAVLAHGAPGEVAVLEQGAEAVRRVVRPPLASGVTVAPVDAQGPGKDNYGFWKLAKG